MVIDYNFCSKEQKKINEVVILYYHVGYIIFLQLLNKNSTVMKI